MGIPIANSTAQEFIKKNSERFFFTTGPTEWALACAIVGDTLVLGCKHVEVVNFEDWRIVCADSDWFKVKTIVEIEEAELFKRIYAFPEQGRNCQRAEILVSSFCNDVITYSKHEQLLIQGKAEPELWAYLLSNKHWFRAVGFRGVSSS